MAKIELLDLVALNRDIPEEKLLAGDVGTVVETYGKNGLEAVEVEFVEASGHTRALLTLDIGDVRKLAPDELVSARRSPDAS